MDFFDFEYAGWDDVAKMISDALHQPAAKFLGYKRGDFPICETQSERILSLPIHQNLQTNEIERVATTINTFFKNGSRD